MNHFQKIRENVPPKCLNIIIITICFLSEICERINTSLLVAFYPDMALMKGTTYFEIGFVIAAFFIIMGVASLIMAAKNTRSSTKVVFLSGMFLYAISVIVSGALVFINNRVLFVTLSLVTRLSLGIGSAITTSCYFCILSLQIPEHNGLVVSLSHLFGAIASTVAPLAGAYLYVSVGYFFPFMLAGLFQLGSAFLGVLFLPQFNDDSSVENDRLIPNEKVREDLTAASLGNILTNPKIFLANFPTLASAVQKGFREATSSNFFIHQLGIENEKVIGLLFSFGAFLFGVTAVISGAIVDRGFGGVLLGLGFLFLPIPCLLMYLASFLSVNNFLYASAISLLFEGSFAMFMMPSYSLMEVTILQTSNQLKYSTALVQETRLKVGSISVVTRSVGRALGSLIFGGLLVDIYSIHNASLQTTVFLVVSAFIGFIAIYVLGYWKRTYFAR